MTQQWHDFKEKRPQVGQMIIVLYKTMLGISPEKKQIWTQKDEEDLPYSPLISKWRAATDGK